LVRIELFELERHIFKRLALCDDMSTIPDLPTDLLKLASESGLAAQELVRDRSRDVHERVAQIRPCLVHSWPGLMLKLLDQLFKLNDRVAQLAELDPARCRAERSHGGCVVHFFLVIRLPAL